MEVVFMASKDNDDKRGIHSKSDNIEVITDSGKDEVIKELFNHFLADLKLLILISLGYFRLV